MSLQLRLLNMILRHGPKRRLARVTSVTEMRRGLARASDRAPSPPTAVSFSETPIQPPRAPATPTQPPLSHPGDGRADGARLRQVWTRGPWPQTARAILYFHGGAYLAGSPETHRPMMWPLARAADAALMAPDYALAPERPFPAALHDAVTAYWSLLDLGWRADRIALAGDSAGGGLAFALLAEISARGWPAPGAALAFSPFADLALKSPSLKRLARREAMLPVGRIAEAASAYLGDADPTDPRASPVYARFQHPPPTLLQVGDREALRDDATRLATALRAGGGDVRLELWPRAPHAFQYFSAFVPEARRAIERAGAFLRLAIPEETASQAQTRPAPPIAGDAATHGADLAAHIA